MNIPQEKLEELATLITKELYCRCGLTLKKSKREPCACGWTLIDEWFEDNCNLTLKVYRQRIDGIMREYEHLTMFGSLPKKEANTEI